MKNGIEYFPLNTNFFDDDKIALVEVDHGYLGSYVLLRIISKIYDSEGYYCHWGEDERKLFVKRIGGKDFDLKKLDEIVDSSLSREFFDRTMYEKYEILTSRGIQKRFFEAVSRRQVQVYREYMLIPEVRTKYANVKFVSLAEDEVHPQVENKDKIQEENKPSDVSAQSKTSKSVSTGFPGATITRKGQPKNKRVLSDELRILSHFFFANFLKPEEQLDKFIRNNELMHARTGGWAKLSSTTRLAACLEWKQMDNNKNVIQEVRFKKDKKDFFDAWKKLFDIFAYEHNVSEDILTDMVRDNINWINYSEYLGKVCNNQLYASEQLIQFLRENVEIVKPIISPILKGKPLQYIAVPCSST